jgi:hypothetical protein
MGDTDSGKYPERTESQGDRAPAPKDVIGHGTQDVGDQQSARGAEGEPEAEGHLMTNPYLLEQAAADRRNEAMAQAERMRRADEAGGDRGLGDRIRDRVRRRDNG